jgi:hypothetical protein
MTHPPGITTKSWLMVAALGLIWGGTFMVQKLALAICRRYGWPPGGSALPPC